MLTNALLTIVLLAAPFAHTQPVNTRERARAPYQAGLEHMRNEAYEPAARAFTTAIGIDPGFEMAHYMLGRAQLALKNYDAAGS